MLNGLGITDAGLLIGREDVTLPPEFLQMMAAFADCASDVQWGIHCARCKQDVVGRNARGDNRWKMECACRTYVGGNPLLRRRES